MAEKGKLEVSVVLTLPDSDDLYVVSNKSWNVKSRVVLLVSCHKEEWEGIAAKFRSKNPNVPCRFTWTGPV